MAAKSDTGGQPKIARKSVFVISPIGSPGTERHSKAKLALEYVIKKALPSDSWKVTRGDGSLSPDSIGHDIIKRIHDCDLAIADLTDHNANVFYELAIAHGWNKPVIHIIERGQSIPFDIADLRVVAYELSDPESVHNSILTIAGMAQEVMKPGYKPITPLSQYRSFENVTAALDPESAQTEINHQILNRLVLIEDLVRPLSSMSSNSTSARAREIRSLDTTNPVEQFVIQAALLNNMTFDRDNFDISEYMDAMNVASTSWAGLNPVRRDKARNLLKERRIPFPDITKG